MTCEELARLIQAARAGPKAMERARKKASESLAQEGISLETDRSFVEGAFLLEEIFFGLVAAAGARAFTINRCMSAIMGVSGATACLTLSTLNDAGYTAFCESDFVVIPAVLLPSSISGYPPFLNAPTYPHDGVVTLANCTAPGKMRERWMGEASNRPAS